MTTELLPKNIEAEESVLSSCLRHRDDLECFAALIKLEDFYLDSHQRVYKACLKLLHENKPVDLVTVKDELNSSGELEKTGGSVFLSRLINAPVSTHN
jgi:replicative DNA helicase